MDGQSGSVLFTFPLIHGMTSGNVGSSGDEVAIVKEKHVAMITITGSINDWVIIEGHYHHRATSHKNKHTGEQQQQETA